ncbi:hypothetical protein NKR23_g6559 [Pleurostoma richardsiae]|uniref:SnoaL-like domain-containing protein n=1 Tax=Pleurostoma richardsiae TaxID=41990 RepID=A0AA38RDE7_9PEZI|nr:hypothetical protein NKR23_g6559 [Pleurostoma richardsiae]
MSDIRAQLAKIAASFVAEFNKWTAEGVIAHRSPNCKHTILPASLEFPPRTPAEYQAFLAPVLPVMRNFTLHAKEGCPPVIDEVSRRLVLHLTSTAETDIGDYANEYVWTLKFNEDGTQIVDIIEFADSAYTKDFFSRLAAVASQASS